MRPILETLRTAGTGRRASRTARRINAIGIRDVPASAIEIGDELLIVAGDRFPCDGIIVEGSSDLGRSVMSGAVNRAGALRMRATSRVSPPSFGGPVARTRIVVGLGRVGRWTKYLLEDCREAASDLAYQARGATKR